MKPIYLIFIRAGGWIAILFVWLGLIIAGSGLFALQNAARLAADGVETSAQITLKTAHSSGRGDAEDINYFVEYVFTAPDGPLSGKAKVDLNYYNSVQESEEVFLRYLPNAPEVHELYAGELASSGKATSMVGAGFTVFGMLLMLGFGLIARRGARLLQKGASAQATVLKKSNFLLITRLKYGFKLPNGDTENGKSFWRFAPAHRGIKARDLIKVKYDRAMPRTSYWHADLTRRK